jgi:ABC-type dipeptide/oligopeptide/nickel transport system permease subunit
MTSSRRWYLLLGALLVGAILFVALAADHITPVDPHYMDRRVTVLDGKAPFDPSPIHPLGTDEWGRDIWSRVAYGARWSLLFAGLIMAGRLALALPLGLLAAFGPRLFRWVVARFYVISSAIPPLLIYLMVLAVPQIKAIGLWPSVIVTVALTTLIEWPRVAVAIQGRLEELSSEQFVEGAIAAGARPVHIFFVHLMPHFWPTLLQTIANEMSRALLTVAQLGIFGIWIGGGILELTDSITPQPVNVTGVPEWGTMLASARGYIRSKPWIPMAPGTAFVIGVVGFNLLAQGLEGVTFSFYRWREATTGRLDRRWRWASVAAVLGLAAWYGSTMVTDHVAGLRDLGARQSAALTAGDLDAYIATISPADPEYREELRTWAESLLSTGHHVAVARPTAATIEGATVKAAWTVSFGYADRPPVTAARTVRLVKQNGQWYETRESMNELRGFHVDIDSFFDPLDRTVEGAWRRYDVRRVSTAADRAYKAVAGFFPAGDRPRAVIYGSQESFRAAVAPTAPDDQVGALRYSPSGALQISPAIMNAFDVWEVDTVLAYDMLKTLSKVRLGRDTLDPVIAGLFELDTRSKESKFDLSFFRLETAPLRTLDALYAAPSTELTWQNQPAFFTQAALLVEYLQQQGLTREQLLTTATTATPGTAAPGPARLAQLLGTAPASLTASYEQYLRDRVYALSMVHRPEWRSEMPDDLLDAIAGRAASLSIEALVMDMRAANGKATVHVLERRTQPGAPTAAHLVIQEWTLQDGRWLHTAGPQLGR